MKFLYKVILGLLLFNSILLLFSGFFPTDTSQYNAINITEDADYNEYKITGDIFKLDSYGIYLGVGSVISFTLIGVIAAYAFRSPVPVGAGLFSSLVSSLWISTSSVLSSLNLTSNPIISGMISLIGICIGVLCFIAIIEMFSGTGGD